MLTAEARTRKALRCQGLEPVPLAAGAGEDWAALSGRPRKANASQYETVMQQRDPAYSPYMAGTFACKCRMNGSALSGAPVTCSQSAALRYRRPCR